MAFVNCLVLANENLEDRVRIRNEFIGKKLNQKKLHRKRDARCSKTVRSQQKTYLSTLCQRSPSPRPILLNQLQFNCTWSWVCFELSLCCVFCSRTAITKLKTIISSLCRTEPAEPCSLNAWVWPYFIGVLLFSAGLKPLCENIVFCVFCRTECCGMWRANTRSWERDVIFSLFHSLYML